MEENRLLTDEEMQTIRNELIRYINIGTPFGTQEMCRTIAKAQDTKTASIKDAEFEKKCKECEYDPQAPEEALSNRLLLPEETARHEGQYWNEYYGCFMNSMDIQGLLKAQDTKTASAIVKKIEKVLKESSGLVTFERDIRHLVERIKED